MPLASGLSVISEERKPGQNAADLSARKGREIEGCREILLLCALSHSILTAALGRRLMISPILEKRKQCFWDAMNRKQQRQDLLQAI